MNRNCTSATTLVVSDIAGWRRETIATLGLKEMSQSTLIRKLCALPKHNPTRKATFEFDKLVRSSYSLDYIRDPQLQRDIHRSQNRIESYHQLRSAIAQIGGKKQLIGSTDLDVAIAYNCAIAIWRRERYGPASRGTPISLTGARTPPLRDRSATSWAFLFPARRLPLPGHPHHQHISYGGGW